MEYGLVPIAAGLAVIAGALAALQYRFGFGWPGLPSSSAAWPAVVRRPVDRGLLGVHDALVRALPGHVVLIDVPVARLLGVVDGVQTRTWERQVRDLAVHAAVCSPDGEVIGVAEIFGSGLLSEAEHERRRAKERLLESAGIRVVRLRSGRLPDDARLRELFVPQATREAAARQRPQWLRVVK